MPNDLTFQLTPCYALKNPTTLLCDAFLQLSVSFIQARFGPGQLLVTMEPFHLFYSYIFDSSYITKWAFVARICADQYKILFKHD